MSTDKRAPCLVVCGAQTIPPTAEYLERIRFHLRTNAHLKGLADAIVDLPELWQKLVERSPLLKEEVASEEALNGLKHWASSDNSGLEIPDTLPNVQLAPLTVIIHLVQYILCLEDGGEIGKGPAEEDVHARILHAIHQGGFQGLCTGFLTATALACARSIAEISTNGAIAMKLAMCIGAYVDRDRRAGYYSSDCLTVWWKSTLRRQNIANVLSDYPETYVSVELDRESITITTPTADSEPLQRDLTRTGARLARIPIKGRYHSRIHEEALQELRQICGTEPSLQFHPESKPLVPLRDNTTGAIVAPGEKPLHELCLRCLLIEPADWYSTMKETIAAIPVDGGSSVLELGLVCCLPRSLATSTSSWLQVTPAQQYPASHQLPSSSLPTTHDTHRVLRSKEYNYPEDSIAIVGAAGRFSGSESLDQLWKVIRTGASVSDTLAPRYQTSSGLSPPAEAFRGSPMSNAEGFDCGMFGISPREARYMDPQQRISLQVAYQAVESSGHLAPRPHPRKDVGCYVGVGASDYEYNVGSHAPTAFSYTGTARAFVSGRISHHFGWAGPSMAIDTACSSSAVAIHQACKDLRLNECIMALAGGVNVISSPSLHRNLGVAKFLNSSGYACRPFDAAAGGYCRGEGCGFVVLKRLSVALADHDNILGVIVGSGTNQCDGSNDPITVPVSDSQANLYRRVLSQANMSPGDVSYVEAHGTGTPRGDPIECQSIRQVFGATTRPHTLYVGSVKANIGHTEAASGIAGLLKALLMIRQCQVPPQANFTSLNPAIPPLEPDHLAISTSLRDWSDAGVHAVCVNNYGASGNNASIIVCQPPANPAAGSSKVPCTLPRYPILLCAQSERSLENLCMALSQFVDSQAPSLGEPCILSLIAFSLAQIQNQTLRYRYVFQASSLTELQHHLRQSIGEDPGAGGLPPPFLAPAAKPVVLVFGGQMGNTVHLSRVAYECCSNLRSHVDQCDVLLRSMGREGLFPTIFDVRPTGDIVLLHCMLFCMQYAFAATWIDAGLPIRAVTGHSIGQLTALAIAGSITLADALRLVCGRASLIEEKWGKTRGCMLAVDIDRVGAHALVDSLLVEQHHKVEIACYNAVRSHILVGTEAAIAAVEMQTSKSKIKTRRLNTTHGFHSELMDGLMDEYLDLANEITYTAPKIPIETCSEYRSWSQIDGRLVAQHSRQPVYFYNAVARIEQLLGPCTWVEGGPGSIGVTLARRALMANGESVHSFHGLSLGASESLESLVDTTVRLWKDGVPVQFWPYHASERTSFRRLELPGYQFDDERPCWLPYNSEVVGPSNKLPLQEEVEEPPLVSLATPPNPDPRVSEFLIQPSHPLFNGFLQGRTVVGTMLCPISGYIEFVAQGAALLLPGFSSTFHRIHVAHLKLLSPLGIKGKSPWQLTFRETAPWRWDFTVDSGNTSGADVTTLCHAAGTVSIEDYRSATSGLRKSMLQRMVRYEERCQAIFDDDAPTALSIQGNLIYKLLEKVVEYQPEYRGIQSITIKGVEAVARVNICSAASRSSVAIGGRKTGSRPGCNPAIMDQFTLLAEIHALCLEHCKPSEAFVCSEVGEVITLTDFQAETGPWTIYTRQQSGQGSPQGVVICDTFVFHADQKSLFLAILGAQYSKLSVKSLKRSLERANQAIEDPGEMPTLDFEAPRTEHSAPRINGAAHADTPGQSTVCADSSCNIKPVWDSPGQSTPASDISRGDNSKQSSSDGDIAITTTTTRLMDIVAEHVNHTQSKNGTSFSPETELHSLGLDSLSTIELEADLCRAFGVTLHLMQLDPSFTFGNLTDRILASTGQP